MTSGPSELGIDRHPLGNENIFHFISSRNKDPYPKWREEIGNMELFTLSKRILEKRKIKNTQIYKIVFYVKHVTNI